jgi:hypothetical protein
MKERRELKATLLTIAGSILVFGVQQGIQGAYIEAGLAIGVSAVAFWGYEHVQMIAENEIAENVIDDLSDEQVKRLIERGSDALRDVLKDVDGVELQNNDGS